MSKPITNLQLCAKSTIDAEVIGLLNKVAALEDRTPTNLARHVLLVNLRRAVSRHHATRNPEPFKAAV